MSEYQAATLQIDNLGKLQSTSDALVILVALVMIIAIIILRKRD